MHPLNRISISKLVLKALSVLFFLGTAFTCVSQNSYDHWAFGSGMHIDFTSGTPTISCNTSINSQEASAVWSNPVTGAFLAYTDGNTVYNGQTNATLSNGTGLTANSSSIESALILPKPGQTLNDIYIFHNNITNTYWSEADLSSGTNGTVTSKNNFLQASGSERCGTAPHGNICPAYWVMISKGMNDSVAVYLVDTNGISATPVVTSTGISGGSARGNIVFSEDCTKIGMSVESKGMYVANFNANTGATSGWTKIGNTTNGFGSAFSPDGTKIYYTSAYGGTLYQYNFSNSTQTALGGSSLSYLALAPDGQIYISKYGSASLGVISSPNAAGTACGFNVSGLTWSLGSSCLCRWGLPNPFHVDIGYHPVAPDTIVLCPGEDTLFTTQVTGDTFNWNTGATTQSVLLDSAGLYYCTIGFGDCASSDSVYLIYLDDVEISGNDVCQSDTTFFTHTTLMPASNIQGYLWDFGDGNTGASANPFHIYSYGDTFDVTLTLTTNSGCELDTSMTVIVHPKPVPAFSFENVCDGSAVQFQSNATEGSASIVSHSWDVTNNGTTDFANLNPQFQYSTFGQYAVEYKVEDALGCKDSLVKPLFVHPIPVADFGVENECFNVAQAFFDSSTVAVGNIANWNWAFGDGATSTLAGPTHLYNAPGTYTVNLTIESDSGCFDSKSMNTVVYFLPIADFYADSVCENVAAAFNSASSAQSGNISQYGWEFGDGVDAAVSSVLHDYDNPGLFDVMHTVVSNYGCVDTIWKPIRIYPAPVTAFRWKNNVCQGDDLPFYDQSMLVQITPGGDEIANWEWILNGDPFSFQQNPTHKTKTYESFEVKLTTTTNYGCSTNVVKTATISPLPIASISSNPRCQRYPSQIMSTSEIPWGLVSEWNWTLGDGSVSTEEKPFHTYTTSGKFPLTLRVTSDNGCVDSTTRFITILETPVPKFEINPDSGCSDLRVTLINKSKLAEGSMTYRWFINGQFVSDETNPVQVLTNDTLEPVFYSVSLRTTANNGCSASFSLPESIMVLPKPTARFDFAQSDLTMFDPKIEFYNLSAQSIKWAWTFGDGQASKDFAPLHAYEKHGTYQVNLRIWNEYGCADSTFGSFTIDAVTTLYIPNAFTPNGDGNNDVWGVKGFNEGNRFHVKIWNRWGELLYENDEMNFSWDGKLADGKLAPVGTYAYQIVYRSSENDVETVTGQFSLVR